jgi:6-phosphogluconolactonase
MLGELPEGTIDWNRVLLVWGDERNVPAEHDESNFRMVREALLDHIRIPPENVLAVPEPGGPAQAAAEKYERLLRQRFSVDAGNIPRLSCILLGIGDDVHTASLFPGTAALADSNRLVVENWVEKLNTWRITMTAPLLNTAEEVAFVISGRGKQQALNTLWHGPQDTTLYPAQLIQPSHGNLWYLIDRDALGQNELPGSADVDRISSE